MFDDTKDSGCKKVGVSFDLILIPCQEKVIDSVDLWTIYGRCVVIFVCMLPPNRPEMSLRFFSFFVRKSWNFSAFFGGLIAVILSIKRPTSLRSIDSRGMQSKLLNISLLIYCKRNIRVLSETPFSAIIKASTQSRNVASDLTKGRGAVYLLNVRKPEYRKAHHEE